MHPLRIKICGVTTPEDVAACAAGGADAIGLNFFPGSSRYVDPRLCRPIVRAIPPFMSSVGVFVDTPMRQMAAIAYQLGLRGIQHHGKNHPIEDSFPFSHIVAFRVRDRDSLAEIEDYLKRCHAAGHLPGAILIDAFVEGLEGGTGQTAPWELLADFQPGVPMILAGGLTPENVAEAIHVVRPNAIDVASGVESSPGKKDPAKVLEFVERAREAAARL